MISTHQKAPPTYQCIAAMLNDPVIHFDEAGALFVSGYSEGLGKRVVLHNLKGNKHTGRQGTYFAKWQKAGSMTSLLPMERRFESRTFDNILDVELFLRPEPIDHSWIEEMDDDLIEVISNLIEHEDTPSPEAAAIIDALEKISDPRCRDLAPERFRVPYQVRCALKDLIQARKTGLAIPDECTPLIDAIRDKIDEVRDQPQIRRYP